MGTMRRVLKALTVLCLAPLAGVSCGNPALPAGADAQPTASTRVHRAYEYKTIKPVTLIDRGPWCATLKDGGVIAFIDCFHGDRLPMLVYSSDPRRLVLFAVESGDTIAFTDGNVRVLATTEHWVAGQASEGLAFYGLRFTVTSDRGVRQCRVDHLVTFCQHAE